MFRNTLPSLLALTLAAAATTAVAAPAAERVSARVQIADLNLRSEAGARVALQRIRQAARTVCGEETDLRLLDRQARLQACIREAVDRTVASADSPTLTALNGGPVATTSLASVE